MINLHPFRFSSAVLLSTLCVNSISRGDDPYADIVVAYDPGTGAAAGYIDPLSALGSPERMTGEGVFPGVVSVFNSPWLTTEIVSIGAGGSLTLQFNTPISNDPLNPYGIDLIIFSNSFFTDDFFPAGQCGAPCLVSEEGGIIEVSPDGINWATATGVFADGLYPTQGYTDATPYQGTPGAVLTNFTRPIDPRLTAADFDGIDHTGILDLYYGSGGGVGVDIGALGLSAISFVRISNPVGAMNTPEIDAVADVAPRVPGDVNFNGIVNIDDLVALLNEFGIDAPGGVSADLNGNGVVNIDDLVDVLNNFTN